MTRTSFSWWRQKLSFTWLCLTVTLRVWRGPLQLHLLTWSRRPWRSVPWRRQARLAGVGTWGILQWRTGMSHTSRVVLSVLQPGYQPLVLLPKVSSHQGRLANNHDILSKRVNTSLTPSWLLTCEANEKFGLDTPFFNEMSDAAAEEPFLFLLLLAGLEASEH